MGQLKAELARLRRELASLPVDGDSGATWSMLFDGSDDERAAHLSRHRERCRLIALDTPTGKLWLAEHHRLGLPDPTDVPTDVVERLIAMVSRPTPNPNLEHRS